MPDVPFPAHNQFNWDDDLKAYLDDREAKQAAVVADAIADAGGVGGAGYERTNIVFDGDSYFAGPADVIPKEYTLPGQSVDGMSNTTMANFGVSGQSITQMAADAATQVDTLYDNRPGTLNICVVGGGSNDLNETGTPPTPADVLARKQSYHAARRAVGWKTVENTVMPRSQQSVIYSDYDTKRQQLNTLIRNNAATYADALADPASDSILGDFASTAKARYFFDGLHLSAEGISRWAVLVKAAIASVGGSTAQTFRLAERPRGNIFLPAGLFNPSGPGTAPARVGEGVHGWVFPDAGSIQSLLVNVDLPRTWGKIATFVHWAPQGSGTAQVAWFVTITPLVTGKNAFSGGGSIPGTGVATTGGNVAVRTEMGANYFPTEPDAVTWSISLTRNAGSGDDTFTQPVTFFGFELVDREHFEA